MLDRLRSLCRWAARIFKGRSGSPYPFDRHRGLFDLEDCQTEARAWRHVLRWIRETEDVDFSPLYRVASARHAFWSGMVDELRPRAASPTEEGQP